MNCRKIANHCLCRSLDSQLLVEGGGRLDRRASSFSDVSSMCNVYRYTHACVSAERQMSVQGVLYIIY